MNNLALPSLWIWYPCFMSCIESFFPLNSWKLNEEYDRKLVRYVSIPKIYEMHDSKPAIMHNFYVLAGMIKPSMSRPFVYRRIIQFLVKNATKYNYMLSKQLLFAAKRRVYVIRCLFSLLMYIQNNKIQDEL